MKKTNAARLLDKLNLPYELARGEVDESDLSALALAASLGVDPRLMYKTLVLYGESSSGREVWLTCIPGPAELDLKKAARAMRCKSAALAPLKDVLPLTGYVRGGCSPLAGKKDYPVLIDESAVPHEKIYVSAGLRGLQLLISPDSLLLAARAEYADLCKED